MLTTWYWCNRDSWHLFLLEASFDTNVPSESEKVSGLSHCVSHNRPIHIELTPNDTTGGSVCLSELTTGHRHHTGIAKEIQHVTLRLTTNETNAAVKSP